MCTKGAPASMDQNPLPPTWFGPDYDLGSQHPSPNVKNPLQLSRDAKSACFTGSRASCNVIIWLDMITSRDAKSACFTGSRASCNVIIWLEMITSRDAKSACSTGSRPSCNVIILFLLGGTFLFWLKKIATRFRPENWHFVSESGPHQVKIGSQSGPNRVQERGVRRQSGPEGEVRLGWPCSSSESLEIRVSGRRIVKYLSSFSREKSRSGSQSSGSGMA